MDAKELLKRYGAGERDFQGLSLRSANLAGINLSGANLRGAELCLSNLNRAILNGTDLSGANLTGIDLVQADLRKAHLVGTKLLGADLRGANLADADLTDAMVSSAFLTKANLQRANLARAILPNTLLRMADLSHANLREAVLAGADLRNASLSGADVSHVDLIGSGRAATALPDGTVCRPNAGYDLDYVLEKFTLNVDTQNSSGLTNPEMARKKAYAAETQLIYKFLTAKFELLASEQLRLETSFGAIQLSRTNGQLLASLELRDEARRAIVRRDSEFWPLIDPIVREKQFLPIGPSPKHPGFLEYEYTEIPAGYRLEYSDAKHLWSTWLHQRRRTQSFRLLHKGAWLAIDKIIMEQGLVYISIQRNEISFDKSEMLVWLRPVAQPMLDTEATILQI